MKNSARMIAAVAAAGMVLALAACSGTSNDSGKSAGPASITLAIERAPGGGWDPTKWNWSTFAQLSQASYDGYLHGNPDGSFSPALATAWKWTSDTDFEMTLRSGVTFADGEKMTADVVKQNLELQSKGQALSLLKSVDVAGDDKVILHFASFFPDLELVLSQQAGLVIGPKGLADPASLSEAPDGAGPYTFEKSKSVSESTYVFSKNPDYWDAKKVGFDTMTFKVIDDAQAAFSALQSGQIDMSWARYPNVDAAKGAGFKVFEGAGSMLMVQFVDMAGKDVPALADERVRQAINYAVDREAYEKNVSPGRVTSQWANSETEAYDKSLDDTYTYDVAKAKELLAAAGYPDGFTLPISTTTTNQTALEAIAGDLAKVGVKVQQIVKPIAEWVPAATAGQFPAILVPLSSNGSYTDFASLVLPTGSINTRHYDDQKAVELFDAAATQRDTDKRITAWHALSKYVTDDAWTLPMQQTTTFYFYNDKKVTGVKRVKGTLLPAIYWLQPAA